MKLAANKSTFLTSVVNSQKDTSLIWKHAKHIKLFFANRC